MKRLLVALLLAACATTQAPVNGVLTLHGAGGGDDQNHIAHIRSLIARGTKVRIVRDAEGKTPHMISGGTLYLAEGLDTCTIPEAWFHFHGPSYYGVPAPVNVYNAAIRRLAPLYGGGLGRWYEETFISRGPAAGIAFVSMTGERLAELGYVELCDDEH